MPISGLVVTFESPVARHTDSVDQLRGVCEIEMGDAHECQLAITVDSPDRRRDQEIWKMVRELPGVVDLAVALVAFDQDEPPDPPENESTRN